MDTTQKINYIKGWLQKFGHRDNETFNIEVHILNIEYQISLQYTFDELGIQYEPMSFVYKGFKNNLGNLESLQESFLTLIIEALMKIKINY